MKSSGLFGEDIFEGRLRRGLGTLATVLYGSVNGLVACSFDSIELLSLSKLLIKQVVTELEDRILLLPLVYLFLRTILTRIRGRVTVPALGDSFDEDRPLASAHILDHLVHRLTYS